MVKEILVFHGADCPDCTLLIPKLKNLENEFGVKFNIKEVWHDEENEKLHKTFSKILTEKYGRDTIVPAFIYRNECLCNPKDSELRLWLENVISH